MRRISKWNTQKRNACLSEFRRLLGSQHRKEEVQNAMRAGRSLRQLMADARVVLVGIDDVQLERFRRRYAVPQSLKAVMFAVATGQDPYAKVEKPVVQTQTEIELPHKWGTESYLVIKERQEKNKIKTRAERKSQ
jgi:hypothetical protein